MTTPSASPGRQPAAAPVRTADPSEHTNNGEENTYPNYVAAFHKGLPHDEFGEVDPQAYRRMLHALASGEPEDFERIPLDPAGGRKLVNPQAGMSGHADGMTAGQFIMPPAPRLDSPESSAEMAELYWMSLLRDVPFARFAEDPLAVAAAAELSAMPGLRAAQPEGRVTAQTLFRGDTPGDHTGPYVSQFLLRDVQFGVHRYPQRQDTVRPGQDYATTYATWLRVQRGLPRKHAATDRDGANTRYLGTPRDLSHYVHYDGDASPVQPFLNAVLILLEAGAPLDGNLPYRWSANQDPFATFGMPHLVDLLTETATRALRTVWFQKWFVHRRIRPETVGGRIHNHLTGRRRYDFLDAGMLQSEAVGRTFAKYGTYLLPQAYPEGSPLHPSYGAGHATCAGACATVLKAWFDESAVLPDPVVPDAAGTALVPYTGADAGRITVGGELNKLAANIANGRNIGGVHYRSDYTDSVRLGERLAIEIIRRQKAHFNESHSVTLTRFDGQAITV